MLYFHTPLYTHAHTYIHTLAHSLTHYSGALTMLLEAIEQELREATDTDEREMWSNLVHDQPQIVEVEELKTRLQGRVGQLCSLLTHIWLFF